MSNTFDLGKFCDSQGLDCNAYMGTRSFHTPTPSEVLRNQLSTPTSAISHWDQMDELVGKECDLLSHALITKLVRMHHPKDEKGLRVGTEAAELLIVGNNDAVTYISMYPVGHQRDSLADNNEAFSPFDSLDNPAPFKVVVKKLDKSDLKLVEEGCYKLNDAQRISLNNQTTIHSYAEPADAVSLFFRQAHHAAGKGTVHIVDSEGKTSTTPYAAEHVKLLSEAYTISDGGRVCPKGPMYPLAEESFPAPVSGFGPVVRDGVRVMGTFGNS